MPTPEAEVSARRARTADRTGARGGGQPVSRARPRGRLRALAAVDSDQFANRATAALQDDSVRSLVAEKRHGRGRAQAPGATCSPRGRSSSPWRRRSSAAARSPSLFRAARARRAPRAVRPRPGHGHADRRRRRHGGRGRAARSCGRRWRTEVGATRPRRAAPARHRDGRRRRGARCADTMRAAAPCSRWCSRSLLAAGALALAPDRRADRRASSASAWRSPASCSVVVVGVARSLAIAPGRRPGGAGRGRRDLGRVPGDLRTAAWILAGCGAVVAAAAASLIRPVDIGEPLRRARRLDRRRAGAPGAAGAARRRASSLAGVSCSSPATR